MARYATALIAVLLCLSLAGCIIGESPTPAPQPSSIPQGTPTNVVPVGTPGTSATSGTAPPVAFNTPATPIPFISTPGVGTEYAAILEPLGRAYAEDNHLNFRDVQTSLSTTMTGDPALKAQW